MNKGTGTGIKDERFTVKAQSSKQNSSLFPHTNAETAHRAGWNMNMKRSTHIPVFDASDC